MPQALRMEGGCLGYEPSGLAGVFIPKAIATGGKLPA
jgi:hypothetical protein